MTDELNDIFEKIKGWSVEQIQSILYHRKWTQRDRTPFKESGKSEPPPKHPPESFDRYQTSIARMLNQGLDDVDAEQSAKIIVCSTFLLVDDTTIDGDDKFSQMRLKDGVHSKLLELLDEIDEVAPWENIQKRQLFYALFKQREDSAFTIKKVTWKNVTSDWGPKIVMSDGKDYHYIFSNVDDFKTLQERYNIGAALGHANQYESNYDRDENEFNLNIIKVLATKDCLTLAEYFKQQKFGLEGNSSGKPLFERLGEEFFRKELNTELVVKSDELKKILPRLMQEEEANTCLRAILSQEKKWRIPRTQIQTNNQTFFAVHGDEWGGNFLVSKYGKQVFVIDFEDVIYANANDAENLVGVGGDLSSRIFNATKKGEQTFLPIGLSTFASIGRLLAAVVQYHSRYDELKNENIREIIHDYTESFAKALEESSDEHCVVKSNYWDRHLQQLILLHAWDWALYWRKKSAFPLESFEAFVNEIKNLLCKDHADKTDSTHKSSPPDTTKIEKMPSENRDAQSKKTFNDKSIELADDAAWGHYKNEDFAEAEEGWRHAIQLVPDSTSTEDLGYFWYWMTRASYRNKSEASKTLDSINTCIDFCKSEEDDVWLMEALLFLAHLHLEDDEIERARLVLNQVVGLYFDEEFEEEPDAFDLDHLLEWPGGRHRLYSDTVLCQIKRQVANLLWDEDDLEGAAKLYENLMNYYKGTMKHDAEDNARVNLGILKSFMGEYEESDALQNQCLEYRRKIYNDLDNGDAREITKALRNLGQNAMAWKKFDKAISYFDDCISRLRQLPNEVVPHHIVKDYIAWNENNVVLCKILNQIKLIHLHYRKREDKIEQLRNLADKSSTHLEQCLPHLMRLVYVIEDCISEEHYEVITDFSISRKLEITNLLICRFGQYKKSLELLSTVNPTDLGYNQRVDLCLQYEEIHFSEYGNKAETLEYHSRLEEEYLVKYSSLFDGNRFREKEYKQIFTKLEKYQTSLVNKFGIVQPSIYLDQDCESFRDILNHILDSGYNPKALIWQMKAHISGHFWPFEEYITRSIIQSVCEEYSMAILENIDILWNISQSKFVDISDTLDLCISAMGHITRSKDPNIRRKRNFAKERYKETTKLIEPWYSQSNEINGLYNKICELIIENSMGKQLDNFSNLVLDLIEVKDNLNVQNSLFSKLMHAWNKSISKYNISTKQSGYRNFENKVVEFAKNLCIWVKQQPEKIDFSAGFDQKSGPIAIDLRIYTARNLMGLYNLKKKDQWPFDVLLSLYE